MPIKKLLILALIIGAGYYVFGVKGFNPFAKKIRGDIQLYTLDGQQKTLNDYAGENGTFIFYMATWCPHCAEEVGFLKSLQDFFRLHKIGVVICMTGGDNDEIHGWVYKQDLPWDWRTVYWQDPLYDELHMKKNFRTLPDGTRQEQQSHFQQLWCVLLEHALRNCHKHAQELQVTAI